MAVVETEVATGVARVAEKAAAERVVVDWVADRAAETKAEVKVAATVVVKAEVVTEVAKVAVVRVEVATVVEVMVGAMEVTCSAIRSRCNPFLARTAEAHHEGR